MACWPREQAERRQLLGGDSATAVEVTGKGAQEGQRTTENVVAHTVGHGEARNGGDAMAASSAMADVAMEAPFWRACAEGELQEGRERVRDAW